MQIEKLFTDYGIPYSTQHKNIRDGWIGLDCPFCGTVEKYHLGYNLDENYFSCWQCGGHAPKWVLSKLLGVSTAKAESIALQYGGKSKRKQEHRVRLGTNKFEFPRGTMDLQRQHKLYLEGREFCWEDLVREWDLSGTAPIAKLDDLDYGNRILAPISWDGRFVSFQARDITNKHFAKYMACPPEREIISHKHIIYGRQDLWGKRGLCVEGITDVWRLGTDAFCTFGIKFTREQIRAIVTHFEEVVVIYDPEKWAQWQARQLIHELNFKGVKAWKVELECDPGDLSRDDADHLVKNIMK